MTDDERSDPAHTDAHAAALDRALRALPDPTPDPLWTRATLVAAQRRLTTDARAPGMFLRYEPLVLVALSVLQLTWAALRVFAFAR